MPQSNQLSRLVHSVRRVPKRFQPAVLSFIMGKVIPFAGTAGTRVEKLEPQECIIVLRNRRKVRNHIGSVHAAAMALLAESATGFMTGLSVPDDRIIVIRKMELEYVKRASGDMKAVASFSDEQLEYVRNTEKGDIQVPVTITDASGTETVKATMVWAWTPKKRPA
jgi:acyl-coenzyme A thioesterase PaaI-like protein